MQTSMAFTLQIFGFAYTEQEELLTSRMGGGVPEQASYHT